MAFLDHPPHHAKTRSKREASNLFLIWDIRGAVLCYLTRCEVCCVVPLSRFRRLSGARVVLTSLALDLCSRMVSDGFQTQKRISWILRKERAERVLAIAISIDGRKEWTCNFCSESKVWTRWRCRRCYHDIPACLRGKYRQAIAARTGERSTGSSTSSGEEERRNKSLEAENKELRARLEDLEKKEGEGAQGGQRLPSRRERHGGRAENGHGL